MWTEITLTIVNKIGKKIQLTAYTWVFLFLAHLYNIS